MPVSD